jgi:predicted membrane channel-forming protein YqfA (hemolysin III family)
MHPFTFFMLVVLGIVSLWVYFDAGRYKVKGAMRANDTSPLAWALGTFLFFIFAFPFYLFKRAEYDRFLATPPAKRPPEVERPMSGKKQLLHALILLGVLLVFVAIFYHFVFRL